MNTLHTITAEYQLYVLCSRENSNSLNLSPFGLDVEVIDCTKPSSAVFIDLVQQLDGLSYGNKSMAMDKWVMLDCGMLPSAIVGVAKTTDKNHIFDIPTNYNGLIPVSEYCCIPTVNGKWVGHTCATIEKGKGVGLFSKLLGLSVCQVERYIGVAQYDNPAVKLHTKIADLKLKSAITPAHDQTNMTFIYEHEVGQEQLECLFTVRNSRYTNQGETNADVLLDPFNEEKKKELQSHIENGNEVSITYPGHIWKDNRLLIPLKVS